MEEMIARWIRESILEFEKAKKNQNYIKMKQMRFLQDNLFDLRDKALKFNK